MGVEFLYLEPEDQATALAFGIKDENEALAVYGGLKAYMDFVAARKTARESFDVSKSERVTYKRPFDELDPGKVVETGLKVLYDVPELPQTPQEAMARIPEGMGITEKIMYATLVKQQMDKVSGIMGALASNRVFEAYKEQQAQQKETIKRMSEMRAKGERRPW